MPDVSVVIPLYNKASHIERTINSVIIQTFKNFEIIIINDGSTDNSAEIVQNIHNSKIKFFNQKNQGVSVTRNTGVNYAQSDFIAFLDADDEWMPKHLETLMRLKLKYPESGLFSTSYKIFSKNEKFIPVNYQKIPNPPFEGLIPNYFKSAVFGDQPVCTITVGVPKKIFLEMGGFQGNWGEDIDLWAKIALQYPIAYSSEISAIYYTDAPYRLSENYQSTLEIPIVRNGKKLITMGHIPENLLPFFKEYIARKAIDTVIRNLYAGDIFLAQKQIGKIQTQYFWVEKILWTIISRLPLKILEYIINNLKYVLKIKRKLKDVKQRIKKK